MHISTSDKQDCSGCTACASICPKGAIKMVPDVMGFLYPEFDESQCIDCGLCVKVCQFKKKYNRYDNFNEPLVYGVRHRDKYELDKSQSGAASWAIIQTFLEEDGVVYGAAFDTPTIVCHQRATTLDECQKFRTSKYVQSNLTGVFLLIKKDLLEGCRVLFFGTGCQVAGLKSFIPKKLHENLFTVDLVCHASPAPGVWKGYVEYLQKKYHSQVVKASFRNKSFGWHSHTETINLAGQEKMLERTSFRKLFYDHVIIRPSCTQCPFTNFKRVSDLTVADFWGWEKYYWEWNDNKGVSLLLINSERGKYFFAKLGDYINSVPSTMDKCVQPQLRGPVDADINEIIDAEKVFGKGGYKDLALKYGDLNPWYWMKTTLGSLLRKIKLLK